MNCQRSLKYWPAVLNISPGNRWMHKFYQRGIKRKKVKLLLEKRPYEHTNTFGGLCVCICVRLHFLFD